MMTRWLLPATALLASLTSTALAQGDPGCSMRRLISYGPPIEVGGVRDYSMARWPTEDNAAHITVMSGLAADGAQLQGLYDQIAEVVGRPMHIRHADALEPDAALVVIAGIPPRQLALSPMAVAFFESAEAVRERFDGRPADSCFANTFHWQDGYSKIYKTFGYFPASAAGRARQACHAQLVLGSLGIVASAETAKGLLIERDDAMRLNERGLFLLRALYTAKQSELLRTSIFYAEREPEYRRRFCR